MSPQNPDRVPAGERELLERARAALDVTPLSVAAGEGLDAAGVARLLAGKGDCATATRLARAFHEHSARLRMLARQLTEAAGAD